MDKPLFIPLISKYYEAFKDGSKTVEYRINGKRWNRKTCYTGRPVTLSKGYGKKNRLQGKISRVWVADTDNVAYVISDAITSIYGPGKHELICIEIHLPDVQTKDLDDAE